MTQYDTSFGGSCQSWSKQGSQAARSQKSHALEKSITSKHQKHQNSRSFAGHIRTKNFDEADLALDIYFIVLIYSPMNLWMSLNLQLCFDKGFCSRSILVTSTSSMELKFTSVPRGQPQAPNHVHSQFYAASGSTTLWRTRMNKVWKGIQHQTINALT